MSTCIIDFKSHKTKCKTSLNTTSNWSSKIWRFTTWSIWRFCITLWYNFMYTSLYKTNYLTDFHWKRIWSAPAQYTSKWPAHYQDLFSFKGLYLEREFDIRNTCCWNFVYPLQPDSNNKTPISNILSAICCHTYITWSWKKHLPCACACSKIN